MEEKKRPGLKVVFADGALQELDEIWAWNDERHGVGQANRYIEFLLDTIDSLVENPSRGARVKSQPRLQYMMIQRRKKQHDQVVIFSVGGNRVDVLHVFHSAQDWEARLDDELG
jgi:plasmid stabilization system protein ParE